VQLDQQVLVLDRLRSMSFGGAKRSRINLNTYGNEGSVNTGITSPLMPGGDDEAVARGLRW